MSWTVRW